jgi:hypothetical protein
MFRKLALIAGSGAITLAVMGGLAWTAEPTLPAYSALGLSPEQQQRIDEILGANMQRFAALRDQNPNDDAHLAKAVRSTKAQADSEILPFSDRRSSRHGRRIIVSV